MDDRGALEFRLLGPLEAELGGFRVPLGGAKQRAVLALLLLRANEVVPRSRLVDELWGEEPPEKATASVHVYVSNLRKALAVNGGAVALTRRGAGYALEIDPARIDAHRFRDLVDQGRSALESGDAEAARGLLREALSLWRGPALADLQEHGFTAGELAALESLRLDASLTRMDADLASGRTADVLAGVESLLPDHPYEERLRELQMRALYAAGRQADALGVYQETRARLGEELGLEPGPRLRELEREILRQDPALAVRRPEAAPLLGSPRPRSRLTALAVVFALAAGGGLAAWATLSRGTATAPAAPNSVAVIDPRTNRVVGSVAVGVRPGRLAFGLGSLWVANEADRTVSRVDPASKIATRTIALGATPTDVAAGDGGVWVAHGVTGLVSRIDPRFDVVARRIRATRSLATRAVPHYGSIAVAAGAVWAAFGDGTLVRIDPRSSRVVKSASFAAEPAAIAASATDVWLANANGTVDDISTHTYRRVGTASVAGAPRAMAVAGNALWVTGYDSGVVSRVVGPSGVSVNVGASPEGVAVGAGSVWVANSGDGTVSRIDPFTRRVVATVRVGHSPADVAFGDGRVWVSVEP